MKLRVLIVDDEPLARARVRELLREETDVEIVGEARNGIQAVEAIKAQKPDLVFLDVKMPGLDGFGVLRALEPANMPAIIFVTAYDKHAVEAFEVHALDYLLKPYQPKRFKQAVAKAREHLADNSGALLVRLRRLLEAEKSAEPLLTRFAVKSGGRTVFVPVKAVEWIEAAGNYLILHVGKENHLIRDTLAALEGKLPSRMFVRVNRSALVNSEFVKGVEAAGIDSHVLKLKDGTALPVTRSIRELEELLRFG